MTNIDEYKVGMTVYGRVTGIKPYGAFIKFDDGVTGLIHISEISNGFVKNIDSFMNVDEYVILYDNFMDYMNMYYANRL